MAVFSYCILYKNVFTSAYALHNFRDRRIAHFLRADRGSSERAWAQPIAEVSCGVDYSLSITIKQVGVSWGKVKGSGLIGTREDNYQSTGPVAQSVGLVK